MRTQSQSKVKPSIIHSNPELLILESKRSNERRKSRKLEQERLEQERLEQERIRLEEETMWSQVKKESKPEKKVKQGKIKASVDGIEFDNLSACMAYIDPVLWGKRNDYRDSCWTKINRQLKKDGICIYGGHTYKLI